MHKRNWWSRRGLWASACVLVVLAIPAWGDPDVAIRTPQDWESALALNYVRMCEPGEWFMYMNQWRDYLVEGEPYPTTTFMWPDLYVSHETGGGGGGGGGLVMLWGDPGAGMTDGPYASAWKFDYQVDPDLSDSMVSLSVFAPMARPNPNGIVKITQISFGIQDINGNTRSWYWNVGPGTKVPWNVLKRFTIDCSQPGVNATTPPADSYMSHPLFNIAQSQFFIADENGLLVGGTLAIPPPPTPHPGIWNLWHDILVMPRWEYKWQQPPDPTDPNDLYLGWNERSDYWNGPIVADDWVCTTLDPLTGARWWGSFIGWDDPWPPQLPNHFHIAIWSDVPAIPGDPNSFSHPGYLIQEFLAYPTSPDFTVTFVGWDFDPRTSQFESCFRFDYDFPAGEYFEQPAGQNIYWVSIAGCEAGGPMLPYPFGWKTRPRDPNNPAPDDAVVMTNPVQPVPWMWYIDGYPLWFPTRQDSWDMAFELTSRIEGTKIWEQPPDLEPTGMDVNATKGRVAPIIPYTLADDFMCIQTGPITQIVVFGSWWHDVVPNLAQVSIKLDLRHDVPAIPGDPNSFSHPGTLLWARNFTPGTFQIEPWVSGLQEGWYDPNSPTYEPAGDTVCWRLTFNLDPNDPNTPIQQGTPEIPVIYWLDVHATTPSTPVNSFGWKTSPAHGIDAAVWAPGTNPAPTAWRMLTYPPMHPLFGTPMDLAFMIIGAGQNPQQTTKWSQPPEPYHPADAFNGWDQYSVYNSTIGIVADDWVCTSWDPVSDIHWWGSFIGWDDPWPPQLPDAFFIRIWSDVPKDPLDPNSFSHPGWVLWENMCTTYEWGFAGWDFDPRATVSMAPEATFEFTQHLPRGQWFPQDPDTIFWVSIAAVYNSGVDPPNPFGWKTRPRDLTSLAPDDAVVIYDPTGQGNWEYVSGAPIEYPAGTSWDMAFEISTTKVDRVVCEPAGLPNPFHPPTYWYDVTPAAPRYDFHVRVWDTNPANYTNWTVPTGWSYSVHQLLSSGEWWASWWDPHCANPITATFRFQFDNQSPRIFDTWTTTTSCTDDPYYGVADQAPNHAAEADGYGYRVHVPKPYRDTVVCEPQGSIGNPFHPPTYWYDVTPDSYACDFHVRVYDPNPALYTNPSLPAATWQFSVHEVNPGEWWASWWNPNCANPIWNKFRFQFDHRNPSVWSEWTTTISGTDNPGDQVVDLTINHIAEPDGYGYRVHVPRALSDVVVCEPQGGTNPLHPPTYWYDVTPDYLGRCDFHVRVYDTNPDNYTNVSLPAETWQFAVHQIPSGEWYASWWDPGCTNAIFTTFRFQFDNPSPSTWDHWTTTIGASNDPFDELIDRSENHSAQADGYGYRVHVPLLPVTGACCFGPVCAIRTAVDCATQGGVYQGDGTDCFPNPCVPRDYWIRVQGGTVVEQGGTGFEGQWYLYPNNWWNQWWPNEFALDRQKDVTITFDIDFPGVGAPPVVAFNYSEMGWPDPSAPPLPQDDPFVIRVPVDPPITGPGTYTFTTRLPFCPRWVSMDVQGYDFSVEGTIEHICLPSAVGACCFGPVCAIRTAGQCAAQGGVYMGDGTDCFPNPCVPRDYWLRVQGGMAVEQGGTGFEHMWFLYPNNWWNQWWPNEFALDREKEVTIVFDIDFPTALPPVVAFNFSEMGWPDPSAPPLPADDPFVIRVPVDPPVMAPGTYTFTTRLPFCPRWVSMDVQGYDFSIEGTIEHICLQLPTGACCVGWECQILTRPECQALCGRYLGDGTTCAPNPCPITDQVVCEPQPLVHPPFYWYLMTPGDFGRCDFHVRVFDPNPLNYTNIVMPANWVFLVHTLPNGETWASFWDPTDGCQYAVFVQTRFGFTNRNVSTWGDWSTTIGNTNDPYWCQIDSSVNHPDLPDGGGYRVHVPVEGQPVCRGDCNCDGTVGFADIDLFVAGIPNNQANWAAKYQFYYGTPPPAWCWENCDVNGVGTHCGFDDIDPFVKLIPTPCTPRACCFPDHSCLDLVPGDCLMAGGMFFPGPSGNRPCSLTTCP